MSQLQNIPLSAIRTDSQIRTRNGMDGESISGLAASISIDGLLQPICVKEDTNHAEDERTYTVIAGHRRLEAIRQLKWYEAPCMVFEASQNSFSRAQLVENLQRIDLDLLDTANALRALATQAEVNGSGLTQLAADIGKSKSWVSRHLSLTDPKFSKKARDHLQNGSITDLEVAHALNQVEKSKGRNQPDALSLFENELTNQRMTRQLAIDILAMAKKQYEDEPQEVTQAETEADTPETEEQPKAKPIRLSPEQYALYLEKGGIEWLIAQLVS